MLLFSEREARAHDGLCKIQYLDDRLFRTLRMKSLCHEKQNHLTFDRTGWDPGSLPEVLGMNNFFALS